MRGSRSVHSVGYGRVPAGGAMEVEALVVWCLRSARLSFGGGAPWSPGARRSTSSSSLIGGSARLVKPLPDLARRWIRFVKLKKKMVLKSSATTTTL